MKSSLFAVPAAFDTIEVNISEYRHPSPLKPLRVSPDSTFLQLKDLIEKKLGIPPKDQQLCIITGFRVEMRVAVKGGKPFEYHIPVKTEYPDSATLRSQGIADKSEITMFLRLGHDVKAVSEVMSTTVAKLS
jgi:hypothetical protein